MAGPGPRTSTWQDVADRPERWTVTSSEDVWRGSAPFAVRRDTLAMPDDPEEQFPRLVVEHPGACVVLAVDDDDQVCVLRQYRHPVGERLVELPAGLFDVDGEDHAEAARRELLEEAGVAAARVEHLVTAYSSPGLLSERLEFFVATGLEERGRGDFEPEHEERMLEVGWVPLAVLLDAVMDGRVRDAPVALAVLALHERRRRDGTEGRP